MENHSTSDIDIETTEAPRKGLTRRQVAVGAAWAVPVVAVAVGAPAQASSIPLPPHDSPTAFFVGTITAQSSGPDLDHHAFGFKDGSVAYDAAGSTVHATSGLLTLTFAWDTNFAFTISTTAYADAGWVLSGTNDPSTGKLIFTHAALADQALAPMPTVGWAGDGDGEVSIKIKGASGVGFTTLIKGF